MAKKTAEVKTKPEAVPDVDQVAQDAMIAQMEQQMSAMDDVLTADSPFPDPEPVATPVQAVVEPVVQAPKMQVQELEPVQSVPRFVEVADQLRHFIDHLTPTERGLARALVQELQEMWQDIPC